MQKRKTIALILVLALLLSVTQNGFSTIALADNEVFVGDGAIQGYDDGYSEGYRSGLFDGGSGYAQETEFSWLMSALGDLRYIDYDKGYRDGYATGYTESAARRVVREYPNYDRGYETGYASGHKAGYYGTPKETEFSWFYSDEEPGMANYEKGYRAGYEVGFADGVTEHSIDTSGNTDPDFVFEANGLLLKYNGSDRDVVIPAQTKTIAGAFSGNTHIRSVVIPNGVTTLDHNAFYGCTALTSIVIPNSVTSVGTWVFMGCTSLTSVTIPGSLLEIGQLMFNSCTSLTNVTIGNGVKTIGDGAFSLCTSLKTVSIPDSVRTIENGAFAGCENLIKIEIPDSAFQIDFRAFENCNKLTIYGAERSYAQAFAEYNAFPFIANAPFILKPSVKTIRPAAYADGADYETRKAEIIKRYKALLAAELPDEIYDEIPKLTAPYSAGKIKQEVLQNALDVLNFKRFVHGSAPVIMTEENNLKAQSGTVLTQASGIGGHWAPKPDDMSEEFYEIALQGIGNSNIGVGYGGDSIRDRVLYNMDDPAHASAAYRHSMRATGFGISFENYGLEYPSGVNAVYVNDTQRTSTPLEQAIIASPSGVAFPQELAAVGIGMWFNVINAPLALVNEYAITITVSGNGKTWVIDSTDNSEGSFEYNVYGYFSFMPNDIAFLGGTYTISVTGLLTQEGDPITLEYTTTLFSISANGIADPDFEFDLKGQLSKYHGAGGDVVIPKGGLGIGTAFASHMYAGSSPLTSVVIPDGVVSINGSAFRDCTSLKSITIGKDVTRIGSGAFWDCTALANITIPKNIVSIGSGAFEGCTSLTSIIIPEGVTSIEPDLFVGCTSLTAVTIPASATEISPYAFTGAPNVTIYGKAGSYIEQYANEYNLKFVAGEAPPMLTATPVGAKVLVNGKTVEFDAYTINQQTYYQIADIALQLAGTTKQFSASWDNVKSAINLTSGDAHNGTMAAKSTTTQTPTETKAKIYLDGTEIPLKAYTINQHTYYQMNDVANRFNFSATWDGAAKTISLDTNKPFAG